MSREIPSSWRDRHRIFVVRFREICRVYRGFLLQGYLVGVPLVVPLVAGQVASLVRPRVVLAVLLRTLVSRSPFLRHMVALVRGLLAG